MILRSENIKSIFMKTKTPIFLVLLYCMVLSSFYICSDDTTSLMHFNCTQGEVVEVFTIESVTY